MQSLSTSMVSLKLRASWDTAQRLPYNPNAPRKLKKEVNVETVTLSPKLDSGNGSSAGTSSSSITTLPFKTVANLLKRKPHVPTADDEFYMGYECWTPSPPKVENPRSVFNAASLAYIGDCIYELYARRHFLFPPLSIEEYNDRVMAVVRCEAQDALLQKLLNDKYLTVEERDVLRWGKNISSSKTRTRKRAGSAVYNRASSLETLIGYLYLTNMDRLGEVMTKLGFSTGSSSQMVLDEGNSDQAG